MSLLESTSCKHRCAYCPAVAEGTGIELNLPRCSSKTRPPRRRQHLQSARLAQLHNRQAAAATALPDACPALWHSWQVRTIPRLRAPWTVALPRLLLLQARAAPQMQLYRKVCSPLFLCGLVLTGRLYPWLTDRSVYIGWHRTVGCKPMFCFRTYAS